VANRALAASRLELAFAARAWLLAPLVEGALAGLGVGWTLRAVAAVPRRVSRGRPPTAVAPRLDLVDGARWVDRAYALHALRGRCLPRAIVQHVLHRIDGTPSRLVIGVRSATSAIDAHAWVTDPARPGAEEFSAILVVDDDGVHAPGVRP